MHHSPSFEGGPQGIPALTLDPEAVSEFTARSIQGRAAPATGGPNPNNKVVIMSLTRFNSVLAGAALAGAALFGVAGSAQAATYNGEWDPAYGAPFPNLFWKANATIFIPDSCLVSNGTFAAGSCAGLDITSATLSFYQNNAGAQGAFLESFVLNDNVAINSFVVAGNQFAGINTNFFDPVTNVTAPQAGGGTYGFALVLLNNTQAQLEYFTPPTVSVACLPGSPASLCGFSANAAVGTFTPTIPEPSTYALLIAGLGAIGFCARRRQR
ncbi:MAG TPA: PEP-CTERM sorting domain-containing protein [Burkholderiaceae bacterium]|nr:PEP-CTERM sorting domain-containing protein [Burkholderiaceae bacterium]